MKRRRAHEKRRELSQQALRKLLQGLIALEAENTDIDPRCGACGLAECIEPAIKTAINEDWDSAA
jgi:hypothetical protein